MLNTQPFFIVGSGRSGTQMLEKLLSTLPSVEMHHEYLVNYIQPLAVEYYMGLDAREKLAAKIYEYYGAAINYTDRPLWGDSSNKISWIIDILSETFPKSKFVHIVRDGRKVTSSFFHKLRDECYDDRSVAILQAWVDDPQSVLRPPPEKKYWWTLPRQGTPIAKDFRSFDQFQRICFHWGEVNRVILKHLEILPSKQRFFCRLEDLVKDEDLLRQLFIFLELEYSPSFFEMLQRPHNVNRPQDQLLTKKQCEQLEHISGDMMSYFGYDLRPEYIMKYESQ